MLLIELLLQGISVNHDPLCKVGHDNETVEMGNGLLAPAIYLIHSLHLLVVVGHIHEHTIVAPNEVDADTTDPNCGDQDLTLVALLR